MHISQNILKGGSISIQFQDCKIIVETNSKKPIHLIKRRFQHPPIEIKESSWRLTRVPMNELVSHIRTKKTKHRPTHWQNVQHVTNI